MSTRELYDFRRWDLWSDLRLLFEVLDGGIPPKFIQGSLMSASSSRREFLKTGTKVSVSVAIGGLALAGCKEDGKKIGVVQGKSIKDEVLYTPNTKYWKEYYSVTK